MVDFNNETTVTQGSNDIVKIIRLEKRYNLFEALESYFKSGFLGMQNNDELSVVRARAFNLFWEMEGELSRKSSFDKKNNTMKALSLDEIKEYIRHGNEEELLAVISNMNLFLDDIGLTKIDVKKRFDSTRIELENKERKL